jgi:23S rRNA (guanosine2251-2'-O)-methyltransferase
MKNDNLIYGIHAVMAALEKNNLGEVVVHQDKRNKKIQALVDLSKHKNCDLHFENAASFEKKYNLGNHQGVVGILNKTVSYVESDIKSICEKSSEPLLILILDGVTDPHNLGACLRSADASKVDMVIAPKDKSASLTPVVRKVASGAAESVVFIPVTNLARAMTTLKEEGVWLYGACGEEGTPLYDIDFKGHTAIVMGAEGTGLRRLTRDTCDGLFSIPMLGTVESLNVSVATGICLFEALRQRR